MQPFMMVKMWLKEQEAACHMAHTVSEQREVMLALSLLSHLNSLGTPGGGLSLPTFRWVIPLQLIESRSSRVTYRLVSMLILKSITLLIEVNHYSTLQLDSRCALVPPGHRGNMAFWTSSIGLKALKRDFSE